eukprot:7118278-Prymnesium_polylepis.1
MLLVLVPPTIALRRGQREAAVDKGAWEVEGVGGRSRGEGVVAPIGWCVARLERPRSIDVVERRDAAPPDGVEELDDGRSHATRVDDRAERLHLVDCFVVGERLSHPFRRAAKKAISSVALAIEYETAIGIGPTADAR